MVSKQWLEDFRVHLVDARLPRLYVRRIVSELNDHLSDLMDEEQGMSMEATRSNSLTRRLGEAAQVAEATVKEYRRTGFVSRHPWLTFVAAPVPLFLLMVVGYLFALIGVTLLLDGETVATRPVLMQMFEWMGQGMGYVPAAIASGWMCYLAVKSDRDWRWQFAACGLIAILAGVLTVGVSAPTQAGNGNLSLGLGLGWSALHLSQFLVPLVIAALFVGIQTWVHRRKTADQDLASAS